MASAVTPLSLFEQLATLAQALPDQAHPALRALEEQLLARETERCQLRREVAVLEGARAHLTKELAEARRRGADLANLYVATDRLHSTLQRDEVILALEEVVASLVGCEELVVFERPETSEVLLPVFVRGVERPSQVGMGEGVIGSAAAHARPWIAGPEVPQAPGEPQACIPLKVDGAVTGVLVLYRMLAHKGRLQDSDHEMLDLLSVHAGTALLASRGRFKSPVR